ncbi:MAG: acyltransferase [Lachnospiraceae bacterium]|nr:acyltransferase [Lachnospiraceae bacterium]
MGKISKDTSELIKAVAMFLVVIAHYSQWYVTQADSNIMLTLMTKLGRYGVAMFFAISGYGLVSSASKGLDLSYFKKRFLNVYFPYIIIRFVIRLLTESEWGVRAVCSWLTGFDEWFIFVILIFYVIFYFGWKYSRHKILAITAGVLLVSVLLAFFVDEDVWYASNLSFVVGIVFKVYEDKIVEFLSKYRVIGYIVLGMGFAICAVIYMSMAQSHQVIYLIFKVLASVLWALLCLCIFAVYKMTSGIKLHINSLGRFSLECYLLHRFILNLFKGVDMAAAAIICISIAVTLVCSYIVNYLFGKMRHLLT